MIGVYIMSVLRAGLPSMDLQAQYQTFFTGVVVIGAVLLDIYRIKRASEVRILTPAQQYREEVQGTIAEKTQALSHLTEERDKQHLKGEIARMKAEMNGVYRQMRSKERAEQKRQIAQEKEFEKIIKREIAQK
jgi:ribose transport system permease protein